MRADLSRDEAMVIFHQKNFVLFNAFQEIEKLRHAQYAELNQRMERERELNIVRQKLELKNDLATSKRRATPKLIHKGDKTKPALFKWKYQRKK